MELFFTGFIMVILMLSPIMIMRGIANRDWEEALIGALGVLILIGAFYLLEFWSTIMVLYDGTTL